LFFDSAATSSLAYRQLALCKESQIICVRN
jgi:hypothetical protein